LLGEIKITLNEEVEQLLLEQGAVSVGFAPKETLEGGPPTVDMTYILPEAETAICFAVPLNRPKIKSYLAKELPRGRFDHVIDNGDAYLKAYKFAKTAADFLEKRGYKSAPVISNFKYREDVSNWRTKLPPLLALRLVAARSGVGSVGWSGNILVKGQGAGVLLGALVTSAKLEPTNPIPPEDSPCDKCKLCVNVCAFRMFDKKEEDSYTLGGYTFSFSKRNNLSRCYAVCGGLSGLDKTGKWSTWSPGRTPYPKTEEDADQTFAHLFTHPVKKQRIVGEEGSYAESKMINDKIAQEYISSGEIASTTFTENFNLTCGNCQLICTGNHDETAENYRILTNSGCVITKENGDNIIVSEEEADKFEKAGKIADAYVETSERRQYVEKIVLDIFKKLRKEQLDAPLQDI
jgi:epoxyqueuosine reductase QueG